MLRDEFMLFGKKSASPVMDGLVVWIDGQDGVKDGRFLKNRVTGEWLDVTLTGGMLLSSDGKNIIYYKEDSTNGLLEASFDYYGKVYTTEFILYNYDYLNNTIEIGNIVNASGYRALVPKRTYDMAGWGNWTRGLAYSDSYCPIDFDKTKQNQLVFVMPNPNGYNYVNGILAKSHVLNATQEDFQPFMQLSQFPWYTGADKSNKLGCIRLYNRQLTADEVLQNYEYEMSLGRIG